MYINYLEKTIDSIRSIPRLKNEIQELKDLLNVTKENKIKVQLKTKLTLKVKLLKVYIGAIKDMPDNIRTILIEYYFNNLKVIEIHRKYDFDLRIINGVVNFKTSTPVNFNSLVSLSVRLYGVDALAFIWEDLQENSVYNRLLGIDGEDLEDDEDLCE